MSQTAHIGLENFGGELCGFFLFLQANCSENIRFLKGWFADTSNLESKVLIPAVWSSGDCLKL